MSEPPCLLCRIAAGELEARKFVETERVVGLMNDAEPLARGHAVFFPKRHAERLEQIDDGDLAELMRLLAASARALALPQFNVLQNNGALAGQTVFHAHFHLIPKWSAADGLRYERPARGSLDHGAAFEQLRAAFAR